MNYKKYLKNIAELKLYDFRDKATNADIHTGYMLSRCQSMFKYSNLPDTIPARILELYLQCNGNAIIARVEKDEIKNTAADAEAGLYAFVGGAGGAPDEYYRPTIYTVANPYLGLSKNYNIDKDCAFIRSDPLEMGLLPLFNKYSTAISENELSIYLAIINTRLSALISASDDATKKSAEKYLQDIADGKQGVIAESAFLEGLKAQPYGNTSTSQTIQNLIEMQQYLRATWFNDLGLNANYNMKRESLNSNESQLNDDALLPLVDSMLACRKEGIEKVNAMYGTNITVDFNSSWKDNIQEIELKHDEMKENGTESEEKEGKEDE